MSLTPEQVQTIKATVPVLQEHGNAITASFYHTMIGEHPELNNVFNHANQQNLHQPKALAAALYAYASHIDDLGALSPAVEKMCQKHASLYIRPEQYDIVGEYLLRAMGEVLGAALTPPVLEAWTAAYWQLAHLMINREAQIYSEDEGWTDWRELRLARKEKESDVITSFYFESVDGQKLPSFKPGQYISVLLDVPQLGFSQPRQYSLSDAPNPKYYRISVKKEPGVEPGHPGFISNLLHDKKQVGDLIKVSHPAGEFFLEPEQDKDVPIVLLSAGVGLTPMISILNTLIGRNSQQRISFIYGSRATALRAFSKHVRDTVTAHPNVTSTIFIKNPNVSDIEGVDYKFPSRVNLAVLDQSKDLILDNKQTKYFVCGPDSFTADIWKGLKDLGVEEERIKLELFGTGEITKS